MKNLAKIFTAVVAGMFAFACATDTTEDLGVQVGNGTDGATIELSLSLEESRTQLGEKVGDLYPLYWSAGDKISVNGVESGEAIINQSNPANATFAVSEATTYAVAYPAAPAGKVIFAEKQSHVAAGNTFASGVSTMYGYGESASNIQLNHLTGVLKIGVKGEAVLAKAQISTVDRAPIAGAFDIDFETGKIVATAASKEVIEYSFGEGLQLSSDVQYIHVVVPAGKYEELYITLYEKGKSGNVMYATVKAGESKPLVAGNVREFKNEIVYVPNAQLFVIDSAEQLVAFKAAVEAEGGLDMDAIFTEDIDMTGVEWTPIEGYSKTVLGNGYAIKGLTAPLFGDTHASFKGLHLKNVNIASGDRAKVGALACFITATDTITPAVENCSVSGTITINTTSEEVNHSRYGCFVGSSEGVAYDSCVNNANITIEKALVSGKYDLSLGGIVGWLCEFVKSDSSLVYGSLNNCTNNGKISYNDSTSTLATLYVGGMTGSSKDANKNVTLCNNTNNGEVSVLAICESIRLGGIAGYAAGPAKEALHYCDSSINNGKLIVKAGTSGTGTSYIGGIIGNSKDLSYTYCHNNATIELENGSEIHSPEVGGIVGRSLSTSDASNTHAIWYCTNNAPINVGADSIEGKSGNTRVGGITAYTQGDLRYCTNEKTGTITISGNRNTNGTRATGASPRNGSHVVAGICGYKTVDNMDECTNHADIIMSGTINEIHASTVSEFKVSGVVCYTSKNGTGLMSDGTIKLTGTFGCEMQVAGSVGHNYNTLEGDEKSSTNIEVSGACNKGLIIGGVVGSTYVKVGDVEYSGTINITKDATVSTLCYIGGGVGRLMSAKGTSYSSPSGVYCKNVTNNGTITINGTINCTPYIGGCIGRHEVGVDGAVAYAMSNLTNTAAITFGTDASAPNTNVYLAGCVGHAEGTVTTATNSGAITLSGSATGGNVYVAGCVADATKTIDGLTNSGAILVDGTVKSGRFGGCAGYVGIIQNSTNTGSVTFTGTASTDSHCYGIAYYCTTMSGCVNGSESDATLGKLEYNTESGKSVFLGGLARQCITKAENNINYGSMYMNGPTNGTAYIGGMYSTGVDNATYVSARVGCHNYGNIYVNADVAPEGNYNCFLGGFSYRNNNAFSFEDCHNHGDIILKEGITVGNSIRIGGFIGTMETNTNVTFNGCSNSGDIIIPQGVVCGNTTANTTGYVRVGGIVGNQSSGTVTVLHYLKNTGKISVAAECKHKQSISIGGVFGYTKSAFTAESDAVLINEGVVENGATATAGGLRAGGVIGAADATHPATVSFVNTGDVTCTGTFTSNAYVGGVFGNAAKSQANAKSFATITGIGYTGVGAILGTPNTAGTNDLSNCAAGGKIYCYTESDSDASGDSVTYPMPGDLTADNWYKHFYGAEVEESVLTAAGCSRLTEKPSTEIPAAPVEPEVTE